MTKDLKPSTKWKERIAPDEAQRYAGYAQQFASIQARKSKKYGAGRALHRKQLTDAKGTLDVLPNLPPFARHGLFSKPARLDVWTRLSNGGMDRASDRVPDIRGFFLRVMGVHGDSALGIDAAVSQNFTLINQEVFAFPQSAAPIACGAYAVRVRFVPGATNGTANKGANRNWGADFSARLRERSLHWELQLQPFVDEALTPNEDASVNWPTPYTTAARRTLEQQDTASADGEDFSKQVEAAVFDPWQALASPRPLGDVMRARKVVYFERQKGRGAA
jgi:hypothetical protein